MALSQKLCIKCGQEGHTNRVCKNPVTSFGLIVHAQAHETPIRGRLYPFTQVDCPQHGEKAGDVTGSNVRGTESNRPVFLLVERKDTVGFLNLVQGSYPDVEPFKTRKIARYLQELTCEERLKLRTTPFVDLWKVAGSNKRDAEKACRKFESLQVLDKLASQPCLYQEADYLMPKGRLKYGESPQHCAVREFSEETGYGPQDVTLAPWPPFEERFTGTDGKAYRNVFYLASIRPHAAIRTVLGSDPNQSKEVRNVGWFTLQECFALIRPYHQEKKDILQDVATRVLPMLTSSPLSPQRWHGRWSPQRRRLVRDSTDELQAKVGHVVSHSVIHVGRPFTMPVVT
jgi:8-oxo-dGTP pyrophosphatase MutT (NUDIX family)